MPTKRGHIEVPPKYNSSGVGWGEAIMAGPKDVQKYKTSTYHVLSISGWLQSWQNFGDHWQTVIWQQFTDLV